MYFDRIRVFGPEWRIAQLWTALDVRYCPPISKYMKAKAAQVAPDNDVQDTYFSFALQKEGLVVISLSQVSLGRPIII